MKTWKKLCQEVKEAKKAHLSEKQFESKINIFLQTWLNWMEKDDAIVEQYKINFAHTRGYADFVLFHNGREEIVIELKEPNHEKENKDIKQLTDYMKALKCSFGLYVGEELELYYDEDDRNKKKLDPVLVASYDLFEEDTKGIEFIKLIQKESYSSDALELYCNNIIKVSNLAKYWCSTQGKEEIYKYILGKGSLSEDLANKLASVLKIDISLIEENLAVTPSTSTPITSPTTKITPKSKEPSIGKKDSHNTEVFSLDNVNFYPKSKFLIYVIQKLIQERPNLTYAEIEKIIPLRTETNKVLLTKEDWEKRTPDAKSRYVTKKVPILKDVNGQEFYVSSQWTIESFEDRVFPLLSVFGWKFFRKNKK